ncbi:unnamed protein product [Nippostrongylus brasiliensis]|uniref:DUF772 domain-containing protein n=1 Tax=Nippostrongylus brasiliensis TaxID=27835 RepID=A0A0N4XLX4_NIPBR|nr:unnamed protein product [Nippostrongylus brasiliensis]
MFSQRFVVVVVDGGVSELPSSSDSLFTVYVWTRLAGYMWDRFDTAYDDEAEKALSAQFVSILQEPRLPTPSPILPFVLPTGRR